MSQTIICILVLVLVLDRNQERQMIRRKKFSLLLQIQSIFLYFAGGQEVSGHFSISHQRCCWATVSLISQQPRLAQYFASNPIICESFSAIQETKKKRKNTSRSTQKTEEIWKKSNGRSWVLFFVDEVFVSFFVFKNLYPTLAMKSVEF